MSERSTGSGPSWDPAVADADYRSFADFPSWAGCRVDRVVWDAYLGDLRREQERTSEAAQRHAIDVAIRSAAFETGAVEGLYETTRGITHTIAVQAAAWDLALEKPGPLAARLFEAALRTYELVLDAATHRTPVSEAWLRRVQEELCRPQETYRVHTPLGWQDRPLVLGRYKTEPNHVVLPDGSRHAYAPVHRVADEMHRLVAQLGTPAFDAAHPVLQAAYAHHALTAVHPFADGNGRTARALASVYLYRAARVPLLVYSDERSAYFAALNAADAGDVQVFVDFVFERSVDTLTLVTEELREVASASLADSAERVRHLLSGHGGLSLHELERVGQRLATTLREETERQLEQASLPDGVTGQAGSVIGPVRGSPPAGYRWLPEGFTVWLASGGLAPAAMSLHVDVALSPNPDEPFPYALVGRDPVTGAAAPYSELHPLRLRLAEVYPNVRPVALRRIQGWARQLIKLLLDRLADELARTLHAR